MLSDLKLGQYIKRVFFLLCSITFEILTVICSSSSGYVYCANGWNDSRCTAQLLVKSQL